MKLSQCALVATVLVLLPVIAFAQNSANDSQDEMVGVLIKTCDHANELRLVGLAEGAIYLWLPAYGKSEMPDVKPAQIKGRFCPRDEKCVDLQGTIEITEVSKDGISGNVSMSAPRIPVWKARFHASFGKQGQLDCM